MISVINGSINVRIPANEFVRNKMYAEANRNGFKAHRQVLCFTADNKSAYGLTL